MGLRWIWKVGYSPFLSFTLKHCCRLATKILAVNCRLGHREQKDEWSPRRIDVFQRNNVLPPNAILSAGNANSACTAGKRLQSTSCLSLLFR